MENSIIDYIFFEVEENIKTTETYGKLCGESAKLYDKIKKLFGGKYFKEFDEFVNKQLEMEALSNEDYFREGVKIGVRLAVECLYDKNIK